MRRGGEAAVVTRPRGRGWGKRSFPLNAIGRAARAARHRPPRLLLAHEAALANDIDGEEAAGRAHYSGTPALRMPSRTDAMAA